MSVPAGLEEAKVRLEKGLASDAPASELESILRELGEFPVSTEVLRATQVGVLVKKACKWKEGKVAGTAKALVKSWKRVVEREAGGGGGGGGGGEEEGKEKASKGVAGEKRKREAGEEQSKGKSAPAPPAPGAVWTKLGDPVREKTRELLKAALSEDIPPGMMEEGELVRTPMEAASDVEAEMFKSLCPSSSSGVTPEYKAKYRSMSWNLKKNAELRVRILGGDLDASTLVRMEPDELASEAARSERDAVRAHASINAVRGATKKNTTDMFRCAKCKQRKCTYFEMQTRSADEPMTVFITCEACGHRWKS